jgi:hypothetical protein
MTRSQVGGYVRLSIRCVLTGRAVLRLTEPPSEFQPI